MKLALAVILVYSTVQYKENGLFTQHTHMLSPSHICHEIPNCQGCVEDLVRKSFKERVQRDVFLKRESATKYSSSKGKCNGILYNIHESHPNEKLLMDTNIYFVVKFSAFFHQFQGQHLKKP